MEYSAVYFCNGIYYVDEDNDTKNGDIKIVDKLSYDTANSIAEKMNKGMI